MSNQHSLSAPSPNDRWEHFKRTIEQLYMIDKMKVSDVVSTMKNDHGFDAGENQYKYHFKKWNWKRSIPGKKKEQIATHLQSRAAQGKASGVITYKGMPVDQNKIRRYLKETTRNDSQSSSLTTGSDIRELSAGSAFHFATRTFLRWNLPHSAMFYFTSRSHDYVSPFNFPAPSPASDILIASPSASAGSPNNAPSPTGALLRQKITTDRTGLFLRGQHDQLLQSLNRDEKIIMSDWLYQYWLFCFKTAKTWGRGPRFWTADSLGFDHFQGATRLSLSSTLANITSDSRDKENVLPAPSNLCRWLIHLRPDKQERYETLPDFEDVPSETAASDPNDESTWSEWPAAWYEPPLQTRLQDALENNDFSTIRTQHLPLAIPQIAKAAAMSPDELILESLGFSIMSRNINQTETLLSQISSLGPGRVDIASLFPFHLAITYLDGSKACCSILELLFRLDFDKRKAYTNELGHTVLDNLMIVILKSHSTTPLDCVDLSFKNTGRFPGEEIDICGRWDADSPCIRHFFASGQATIPSIWKHKFCHTSVQAICHSIMVISYNLPTVARRESSGLYLRQCFNCGTKLQLLPLHTLVLTAYYLACNGCQDEDMFGMVACLLCMISFHYDPRKTANISVAALFQDMELDHQCDHEELSPAAFCDRLTDTLQVGSLPSKAQLGWEVFCALLHLCEAYFDQCTNVACQSQKEGTEQWDNKFQHTHHFIGKKPPDETISMSHLDRDEGPEPFGDKKDIATLWAAIQAEISTYRRIQERDEWLSRYFSMEELRKQLRRGEIITTNYVKEELLRTHCVCGQFSTYGTVIVPTLSDTTTRYIANLDVWQRATYVPFPEE